MPVITAYLFVIVIWATTPLAIQFSNSSLSFVLAVTLRMVLALFILILLTLLLRKPLAISRGDWKVFFAGALGLYPNMLLVYWCAQFIPSGLMAVILGIYPFVVGIFSLFFLKENMFNFSRMVALVFSIIGLVLLHIERIQLGSETFFGVAGMTISAFLFGLSSVWVKAAGRDIDPLHQSLGVLLLAAPAFLFTWLVFDGRLPTQVDIESILGVGYLAVAGTVIGHTLFFYVLRHCSLFAVSLIPLITPMFALSLGYIFANESLSVMSIIGSVFIVVSLLIYQGVMGKVQLIAPGFFIRMAGRIRSEFWRLVSFNSSSGG
ncbi:MAG: DMT family transporter [Cellvibrionaceae bacterium]|nr:DMT family transporter [Cellvibrionaceae bacterium]